MTFAAPPAIDLPNAQSSSSPPGEKVPAPSTQAVARLAAMVQLGIEAGRTRNQQHLVFLILNRTLMLTRYDRAALWRIDSRKPHLLGVSGQTEPNRMAPLVERWRQVISALDRPDDTQCINAEQLGNASPWQELMQRFNGLTVAWVVIDAGIRGRFGLWLERWTAQPWQEAELTPLRSCAAMYATAWRALPSRAARLVKALRPDSRRRLFIAAAFAVVMLLLIFVRLPLRIVAPCEVIAAQPLAVTAPLGGVIEQVHVEPGERVDADQLLASYDRQVAMEELKVAQQQVAIIEAQLQRLRAQAFDDPANRGELALLTNRLAQEKARLELAEYRAGQLDLRAPRAGVVVIDDPGAWRGRPVQVGQRIMMLVDPDQTRLQVWLGESDNIAFDPDHPVEVLLNCDPTHARQAHLRYVSIHCAMQDGQPVGYRAEADWISPPDDLKLGLRGSAVLYGPRVSLGYWLVRRPLAWIRTMTGW
jgi:hypothetical protein